MAAPALSWLSTSMTGAHSAMISGYVYDDSYGPATVTLSGAMSGTVAASSNGFFYISTEVTSLGLVTATVTDAEGLSASNSSTLVNSTPTLSYLYAMTTGNGQEVSIFGQVSDDWAAGSVVHLSGEVDATVSVNASGWFNATLVANDAGDVSAYAVDCWGAQSGATHTTITAQAPSLSWVMLMETGSGRKLSLNTSATNLYGSVADVAISGIIEGSTTTVNGGCISFTQTATEQGAVQVQVTNIWGLTATASVQFQTNKPRINNFFAFNMGNNRWQICGSVCDEFAAGLVVNLTGGSISTTATVNEYNYFSAVVEVAAGTACELDATVADWWGVQSDQAMAYMG